MNVKHEEGFSFIQKIYLYINLIKFRKINTVFDVVYSSVNLENPDLWKFRLTKKFISEVIP